jgi:hypothetical protein
MENKNDLYLGLEVEFSDCSQPFELVGDNSGTGWYAPSRWLGLQPGVVKCELTDTTSSAGDWSGYFAVAKEGKFSLVAFSQQNRYPVGPGYTLFTNDNVFAVVESVDAIEDAVNDWHEACNEIFESDFEDDFEDDDDCPNCGTIGAGWTSCCEYCKQPDPRIDDVEND